MPILGDLPIVGPIFRSSTTRKTKTELVILITPYLYADRTGNGPTSPTMQKMIGDTSGHEARRPLSFGAINRRLKSHEDKPEEPAQSVDASTHIMSLPCHGSPALAERTEEV